MRAGTVHKRLRQIADAQGWLCWWCDTPMTDETVTREHLLPVSRGGRTTKANLVAAHSGCNQNRGMRDEPNPVYLTGRRIAYLEAQGLPARAQISPDIEQPGLGYGPDGEPLWAPHIGLTPVPSLH